MTLRRVASLHVYPVKGCRGISLERAEVHAGGFAHDRRFMVVGPDGAFLTQREEPSLAVVEVAIEGDALVLRAGDRRARVSLTPTGSRRRVTVWDDEVDAIDVGGDGARFFSEHLRHLGGPVSLVYMPPETVRPVEAPYGREGDRVGFADAYPLLVATLASLADLNERLVAGGAAAVPMDRFRASIVVEGGGAYDEDAAATMTIGALTVRTPKPCVRCQVVTVDQATGLKSKEPLKTLAKYRSASNKVNFAMNAIPDLPGGAPITIAVGDPVTFHA